MLGIRRYKGTAMDLWQGEVKNFACDAIIPYEKPDFEKAFDRVEASGLRHAACSFFDLNRTNCDPEKIKKNAEIAMAALTNFLNNREKHANPPYSLRRLTFVLLDGETYELFQEILFKNFPDIV